MSQSAKRPQSQVPPRRGRARPLGNDALLHAEAAIKRAGFGDPALVFRWPEIAGAEVAEIAEPVRCQPGSGGAVLTLRCESGAAIFVQHQTRTLIARLNAFLGAGTIARIRVVSGPRTRAQPGPAPHPLPATARPEAAEPGPGLGSALDRLAALRRILPGKTG